MRACVRATVCSQVVTKIDRGGLVHGMKKTGVREREREREGERENQRRQRRASIRGWRMVETDALSGQTMIYRGYVRNFHN